MRRQHRPARSPAAILLVVAPLVLASPLPLVVRGSVPLTSDAAARVTNTLPVLGPSSRPLARQEPDLDTLLERAADYIARFVSDFSAAVTEEEYVQTVFRDSASLGSTTRRVLRSDFLLVRRPDNDQLMPFRDVFEVDGRAVRDRQERLQKLFLEKPATAVADAARIAEESSRYNIGPIDRTVNVPTLPLQFLQARYLPRFQFRKGGQEVVDGLRVWRIDYTEKAKPTLIRRRAGDDVPAQGAFWIDAATGRVCARGCAS